MTYDDAVANAVECLTRAFHHRGDAERYGADTTIGDSGIPCLTLAAQLTAEAQAWATLADAITTRGLEAMEAGL